MISSTFVGKYFALHTQGESVAIPKNNNEKKMWPIRKRYRALVFFTFFKTM